MYRGTRSALLAGAGDISGGWWDPSALGLGVVAAYRAIGDDLANVGATYVNEANPGVFNLVARGLVTWSKVNGWSGFATNKWLLTNITPATDQSYSVLVRFTGATAGYYVAAGSYYNAANTLGFGVGSGSWNAGWFSNGTPQYNRNAAAVTAGVYGVAGSEPYLDGVDVGGPLGGWAGGTTSPIAIGGLYSSAPLVTNVWPGYVLAVAVYDCVLTPAQVAAITAAMAAL